MANYAAAEFKPLYIPFDYNNPPCKEYVPPVCFSPLQEITVKIESALRLGTCTSVPVQKLIQALETNETFPFESLEIVEDAEQLLDDLRDRVPDLFE